MSKEPSTEPTIMPIRWESVERSGSNEVSHSLAHARAIVCGKEPRAPGSPMRKMWEGAG